MTRSGECFDLVVTGGRVLDPDSGFDAVADVGIAGGVVRALSAERLEGRDVIDATGMVVAPGFIDTDGFPENAALQVLDGVTTVLDLRSGTAEVDRWYADRAGGVEINYGVSVGHRWVRAEVVGAASNAVRPTEAQLGDIVRGIEQGLEEGAVAVGLGSSDSPPHGGWERIEVFAAAVARNAHVVATLRDELWTLSNIEANLSQTIGAAFLTGAAVQIPHVTSTGGPHVDRLLEMIATARRRGIDIGAEEYPYGTSVVVLGAGALDGWSDDGLAEVQPMDADDRLTRSTYERYRDRAFAAYLHNDVVSPVIEPFVMRALTDPNVSIASHGSDGFWTSQGRGHPRTSGTYCRTLGLCVRERGDLSLMEALRKMTMMPAQRLESRVPAMRNKGRICEGADADLVVFDADRVRDRSTFSAQVPSEGMRHVLVHGEAVVRAGALVEGVLAGRPVRWAPGVDP